MLAIAGLRLRDIERHLVRTYADTTIEIDRIRRIAEAAERAIEWNNRALAKTTQLAAADRERWERDVNPLLVELRNARLVDDRRHQIEVLAGITRVYNRHMPWSNFEEFDQMARGKRPLSLPASAIAEPTDVERIEGEAAALLGSAWQPPPQLIADPAVIAFEKAPQITTQIRPSLPGTLSPENRVFTCKSLGERVKGSLQLNC